LRVPQVLQDYQDKDQEALFQEQPKTLQFIELINHFLELI